MNYFALFNIPKKLIIDKKLLLKNFYKLQLQFHPDLFINSSTSTKKIVLAKSIQINKGYNTLKNFLDRTIYLLYLDNYFIKKENLLLKNTIYLKKYFSLYEELDNLKKNNFNKKLFNSFVEKIEKKNQKYKKQIEIEFTKKNYHIISKMIEKLLFLKKIKNHFKNEYNVYLKKDILGYD